MVEKEARRLERQAAMSLAEMVESIGQHGILQPLVVCPTNQPGHYRIHHGAKRSRASRLAGLSEVPVVVRDAPAHPHARGVTGVTPRPANLSRP